MASANNATPKQLIYCRLIHHGFLSTREMMSWAEWASWWRLAWHRRVFEAGFALANLLHNVHSSILNPAYQQSDISFVNVATPTYREQAGLNPDLQVVSLPIQFHDVVPESLRDQLTWHPSEELRQQASRSG